MANAGTLAIVGVGLIGGSLGMAVRRHRLATSVLGIGRNPATLEKAVQLGAIDRFSTDFSAISEADIAVLATPVPQIISDLARLPSLLKEDAVVTDVGSIKGLIVEAGERHLGGRFVGSHPMAGSEKAGVEAARPDLFVGATWVITPTESTSPEHRETIHALATAIGAKCLVLSPADHDRAVAVTSHLPHVLAYALSSLAAERAVTTPHLYDVAAGSFASATRVAGSSPDLWQGICMANRDALRDALQSYRAELEGIAAALEQGDENRLRELFLRGHSAKINNEPGT